MKEISLYGLGGQGVVIAAHILTVAAGVYDHQYAQGIPAFTAERRGSPVHASVRLSDEPILPHSHVYHPDCVVSFLWQVTPWHSLISSDHPPLICALNLPQSPSEQPSPFNATGGFLNADRLTHDILGPGTPPNAAMLGLFAASTGWLSIDSVIRAILDFWPGGMGEQNARVAQLAFEQTTKF